MSDVSRRLHPANHTVRNLFSRQARQRQKIRHREGASSSCVVTPPTQDLSLPPWWFPAAYQWQVQQDTRQLNNGTAVPPHTTSTHPKLPNVREGSQSVCDSFGKKTKWVPRTRTWSLLVAKEQATMRQRLGQSYGSEPLCPGRFGFPRISYPSQSSSYFRLLSSKNSSGSYTNLRSNGV